MTADEIRRYKFGQALRGYNAQQVDALLDKVAAALDSGSSYAEFLDNVELRRSSRGYKTKDVDDLLERLRLQS